MTVILSSSGEPRGSELALATMKGNLIRNWRSEETSFFEASQLRYLQQFISSVEVRNSPTPTYNCHGLSFASRRTTMDDQAVQQVLKEDGYVQVEARNVLPGDLLLYYGADGEIEHTAIVVERPSSHNFDVPRVVSKWGKAHEVVHAASVGPYRFDGARYFRIASTWQRSQNSDS